MKKYMFKRVLSLFDGMSVAQQALKNIGADVEVYYASEIDEYAMAVTQSNFPNTVQMGSVTQIDAQQNNLMIGKETGIAVYTYDKVLDIDLLIGGSPCQDLSIAKKNRQGLSGERSGLFWEYVRIRDEVKPKYFILENVASMPKEAKEVISEALGVQPVMINASLVSAQNRKRLFWVGKWNGEKYIQVEIPQPEDKGILLKDILEDGYVDREKSYCLDASYWKGTNVEQYLKKARRQIVFQYRRGNWRINETGKCPTLTANMGTGGHNVPFIKYKDGIRKLTPTECLRLQSMPDDYFDKAEYKGKPISNTQRYKMCGNAFDYAVIEHILKHIDIMQDEI